MSSAPIPTDIESVAVIAPSWIGDLVMATPVFRALRASRPDTRLVAVLRGGQSDILAGAPWFDEIIEGRSKGLLGPWRTGRAIKAIHAQSVLLLPNSFRSALGAKLSGASIRVGYDRDRRGGLLTHAIAAPESDAPTSAVPYYIELAQQAMGLDSIDPTLELHTTMQQEADADHLLECMQHAPFILINPGANRADKRWPAERFAELIDVLHERLGSRDFRFAVTGAPSERSILDAIVSAASTPVENLAEHKTTLGTVKAVIRRASLLITNDTGPRHLAAAFGVPTVVLYGPTDARWTTLEHVREHTLRAEPFLPEELVADRQPKACAIDRIPVVDVAWAAERMVTSA
ncbi:MAG: glycosyltransferase family 9 protein [Planctomycetota bacterium]